MVTELLSRSSLNTKIQGLSVFNREIRVTQLADDTELFLKTEAVIQIIIINKFNCISSSFFSSERLHVQRNQQNILRFCLEE